MMIILWTIEVDLEFWRKLARAGPNAVSEGLSDEDYFRLHLATPLEDYLLEQARQGRSIILTGNAGDGKTHLAREPCSVGSQVMPTVSYSNSMPLR